VRCTSPGAVVLVLLALLGCGGAADDGPVEVHWDRDTCAHCNMAISDRRHAAQVRLPGARRPTLFDDPGCALIWLHQLPGERSSAAAVWVRSPDGEGWRDARNTRFVNGAKTPMDYGFVSTEGAPPGSLTLEEVWVRLERAERERRESRRRGESGT
jgi:nitrous oxide reductase accessory protein NosL